MSDDKTYNGWSSYETWNVALWLGNDESSDRYWRDQAQECYDDAETPSANFRLTGHEPFTRDERATLRLAKALESEIKDAAPELEGTYGDLLSSALCEVNWYEIAEGMIEETNKEPAEAIEA